MSLETLSLLKSDTPGDGYGAATENLTDVTPITVCWRNIYAITKKSDRLVLNGINGVAQSGQLVAFMGSSGSGKTTLLNAILSRNLKGLSVDGEVFVNGIEIGAAITTISGYVQQDELFIPSLTVQEHLYLQACLRLPKSFSKHEMRSEVKKVLSLVGLTRCKNNKIGAVGMFKGISGGEGKRLALAAELLNNPSILFCDEPTTGLDSFMAETVMQVLSKLAGCGRTVICTIHQPASAIFNMFDQVVFLARGSLAYMGPPNNALSFLEVNGYPCPDIYNPADFIVQTLAVIPHQEIKCYDRIDSICTLFAESDQFDELSLKIEEGCRKEGQLRPIGRKRTSFLLQMTTLMKRSSIDSLRNPSVIRAKLIQRTLMGFFLSALYFNSNGEGWTLERITDINAALFFVVCEYTYPTVFGILAYLPSEYPIIHREYHDGLYGCIAYYLAKIISLLPAFSMDGVLFISICYWVIGLRSSFIHFMLCLFIGLLIEQTATSFGFMLSAISPSFTVAVSLAGPFLTVFSLTGGLYANIGQLPVYISWVRYVSWFQYGFESLVINQWGDFGDGICAWDNCNRVDVILSIYNFSRSNLFWNVIFLIVLLTSFYTIGFFGLLYRLEASR